MGARTSMGSGIGAPAEKWAGRRLFIRRARQSALFLVLLVVALWGYLNYRADHFTFAWTRPVRVMVLAVVDPDCDSSGEARRGFLQRFLTGPVPSAGNLSGVESWFQKEYERITGKSGPPIEFIARGPVQASTPPPHVGMEESFLARWRSTQDFLDYFSQAGRRAGVVLEGYDAVVFVYFYDRSERKKYEGRHSVASRRHRRGVVFSPLGAEFIDRACVLLAHELCHTFGATDKYRGEESVFPEGFADPDQEPRYPQDEAEVMALGIPLAPGRERTAEDLAECRMGPLTAREIGWPAAGR